ncbi:NAD-dependent DNA ligase LigA [Simkania negevensis]|uniref:DNA ligase n=1 Tax=Simkania negevensis TaxID=83561 RepID=A0ABS3AR69_9BACT|nr:NAD-dependent DNA ligase LigA [Simkania negevensis]
MTSNAEYSYLCQEVWEHNKRYYIDNAPTISDYDYDRLLKRVEEIEQEHPDWTLPSSPTQRVGEMPSEGFATVKHVLPMLSLQNSYSEEELDDFIKRMEKLVGQKELRYFCELKVDGTAISVHYSKGTLTRAVTRGNGSEGDDITGNVKAIQSLPLQLVGTTLPNELEIRGEVFMPKASFEKLNQRREKEGQQLFANPRNAAAGSLKQLNPKVTAERDLAIAFYAVAHSAPTSLTKQSQASGYLQQLGLPSVYSCRLCRSKEEIITYIKEVSELRPSLPFEIDGIVIKIDDLALQKELGTTGKSPRWAVAYKFSPKQATTTVLDITVQVGRTGTLTPVAELDPILLAGSTISRATLHNEEEIRRKDIRISDSVTIEKGGDVIPKIVSVDLSKRKQDTSPWQMPKRCPSCDSVVVREEEEVAVRCPNAPSCPAQLHRRIAFFAGRYAFDIEHLGEKIVAQLIDTGLVKRLSDLFILTPEQLAQLEGFKEKSIHNLLKSIEQAKKTTLSRFILGLGIRHIGTETADLLAKHAGEIKALIDMDKETLIQIEGIGEKVAAAIVEHFQTPSNIKEIEALIDNGVQPIKEEFKHDRTHAFYGKTIVLTGTLQTISRQEATALIKQHGGKVSSSVSTNTHFVVAGDSPGSKLDKAKKLNLTILDEQQFKKTIGFDSHEK